ncbi:MAG TPA: hypothetical protein VME24_05210 [Alphaproteobacteria bacterium]|nr:hypothetical protein [Alphaproteobacteria bacterium]
MKNALFGVAAAAALVIASTVARADELWQIHEWGTFTSLQDESGRALGGINTDDEPVPRFVHGVPLAIQPHDDIPQIGGKGIQYCHPDVTMRLETPVIYFHPPEDSAGEPRTDVSVKFRGGWLTEFYPNAISDAPAQTSGVFQFVPLSSDTLGHLEWNDLQIGGGWPLVQTSAHVWTSPRDVRAAQVRAAGGESEKFLFYRGVGHVDAPLKVSRGDSGGELLFRSQLEGLPLAGPLAIKSLWLVDIRTDGKIAFRTLPSVTLGSDSNKVLSRTRAGFAPEDFSAGNFDKLKSSLKSALMSEGLYDDEAQALLNTWQASYFKSPGLRVFFIVPRAWTDYYLPLQISLPARIQRVMVGRIELVTPEQREILEKLSGLPADTIERQVEQFAGEFQSNKNLESVYNGREALSAVLSVPESYQMYLSLGRFKNALILDEEKRRPTVGLADFIEVYHLQADQLRSGRTGS